MDRKTTANRRLAKKRVQCLNEALCFYQSLCLADSESLRNLFLSTKTLPTMKKKNSSEIKICEQIKLSINLSIQ